MDYADDIAKLAHARKRFEDAVDHTVEAHQEMHRAERFYANSECEGQWEADDLRYLRDQLRPAFSFNIIKGKVDTFLGMYADAQRTPVVSSSGADKLLAEVLDFVKDQVLQDARYERKAARQLKTGTITGECALQIEVEPSTDGQGWIKINLHRIMPFELHWDVSSIEPDRSDARYVFWDRWLSKEEFAHMYPDDAEEWGVLTKNNMGYEGFSESNFSHSEVGGDFGMGMNFDYHEEDNKFDRYYYDRKKNKIRVIRYEYKKWVDVHYATDLTSGKRVEIDEESLERVKLAVELGAPMSIETVKEERTLVCDFVGEKILREYPQAGPFKGFSIIDYVYDIDEETGTPFGLVRNLFDPQMELNKSKSLEIEYMAQSTGPGIIAEQDQLTDEDQASEEMRRPGGVVTVKKGALAEGRVQEKTMSPASPMIAARMENSVNLLNEISTIPSAANLTAAEHQQAGVTVAIRYHKAKQAVSTPFAHHEDAQNLLVQKVCEAIVNAMPDDQLQAVLGKNSKYQVGQGMVLEMAPSPNGDGQMVPKARAEIRDLRTMNFSLDMEYVSENSTLRMIELEMLMAMAQAGVPVDPELMVERGLTSRGEREQAKEYIEQAQRSQAEGAQAERAAFEQQNQQYAMIEGMKAQEAARHNQAQEVLDARKQQDETNIKLLTVWEKADEAEKNMLIERVRLHDQRMAAVNNGGTV